MIDGRYILSTAVVFFMLMDPFGNVPVVLAAMSKVAPQRFSRIILRESVFALVCMVVALSGGHFLMGLFGISNSVLEISGGIILFLMGVKMVFSTFNSAMIFPAEEPYLFPIAVPLICGPGVFSILATFQGSQPLATFPNGLCSLGLAWVAQTIVLSGSPWIARVIGNKALDAFESIMGLLLNCIAIGMVLRGISQAFGLQMH